jgi:hypothetical protein
MAIRPFAAGVKEMRQHRPPESCTYADYSGGRKRPRVCREQGRPARHGTIVRRLCPEHFERLRAAFPEDGIDWEGSGDG